MAFDREAAKQDGYTDEEIDQFLQSENQPVPEQKPIDRTAEYTGTAMAGAIPAIKTAGEVGAGIYGAKKLADIAGRVLNKPQPIQPVAPTSMPQPVATATPPTSALDAANKIVRGLALSKILPAAQVGMGLFYTSPEEVATLKAIEQRKRQGLQ